MRTEKFIAEERADAFVYGTFSTQAPGGFFANVLPNRKIRSQAGITAVPRRGRVFAFDETGLPWELHPATIEIWGLLLGLRSIVDSLRWNGADGSLLMILPRDRQAGGIAPRFVETEASFMWHSFNGHEEGDELVLDFIGYENPDHFIGQEPLVLEVMKGRPGRFEYPGSVRRIRVAPGATQARNEILLAGNFEWPRIDDRLLGRRNRWGFMASARPRDFFWNAVARIDFDDGGVERYDFGDRIFTSEPVFVPDPGRTGEDAGWLLVELYDGDTRRSSLAILDAARVEDGPVARVLLEHHVPISFHGYWKPG